MTELYTITFVRNNRRVELVRELGATFLMRDFLAKAERRGKVYAPKVREHEPERRRYQGVGMLP